MFLFDFILCQRLNFNVSKFYKMKDGEVAKVLKPYLRFDIGDLVFFQGDLEKTEPFTVISIFPSDESHDYIIYRSPARKGREGTRLFVKDKCLKGDNSS